MSEMNDKQILEELMKLNIKCALILGVVAKTHNADLIMAVGDISEKICLAMDFVMPKDGEQ